jgi:hypothetical protein
MGTRQGRLGDDDQTWNELAALDDARLAHYSRTGHYKSIGDTATLERARRYLARLPPAISGQRGRAALWCAACSMVHGFELAPDEALGLLLEWNVGCSPPWTTHELQAVCWRAKRTPDRKKPSGYLLRGDR